MLARLLMHAPTCSSPSASHAKVQSTATPLTSHFTTAPAQSKPRLDAILASLLPEASRAKIQASIKAGLISVNGAVITKPSSGVRAGDAVACRLLPPEPCTVRMCVCLGGVISKAQCLLVRM